MSSLRSSVSTEPSIYSPQPVYHPNVRSPSLHSQTLSDYEPPGKASSLAPPSLCRGSSGNGSSDSSHLPITPTDENLPHSARLKRNGTVARYYSAESSYGRSFTPGPSRTTATQAHTPTQTENVTSRVDARRYGASLGQRSLTSEHGVGPISARPMQRHRSAKELIQQCEQRDSSVRVSTPPSLARRNAQLPPVPGGSTNSNSTSAISPLISRREPLSLPAAPASHCVPDAPSYFSSFARTRGKLRNSLTNLVQLLGDKTKVKSRDELSVPPPRTKRNSLSPSASRTFNALSKGVKFRLGKRTSVGDSLVGSAPYESLDKPGIGQNVDTLACVLPNDELAKPTLLLYQSPVRQNEPSNSTPWMPYMASIHPTALSLQIPNPRLSYLSSSKFQISLLDIHDVRSVDQKDLPFGSTNPPSGFRFEQWSEEDGDLHVFEIESFEGRIERFAVGDFRTRETWVEALTARKAMVAKDNKLERGRHSQLPEPQPLSSPAISHKSYLATGSSRGAPQTSLGQQLEPQNEITPPPAPRTPETNVPPTARSYLPNPWDPPQLSIDSDESISFESTRLPSFNPVWARATLSNSTSRYSHGHTDRSTLTPLSPRSVRAMTSSPSITRLDERSLVKNRLAILERQASDRASPSTVPGIGSGSSSVGPINWDALAEIRAGRPGSRLSTRTGSVFSRRPDSELSTRGNLSGIGDHRPGSVSSDKPLGRTKSRSAMYSNESLFRPRWPFPTLEYSPASGRERNTRSLRSGSANLAQDMSSGHVDTPQIQVLGNIAPRSTQIPPAPVEVDVFASPAFNLVSDRITFLTTALRESDAAHSTKASGLGQILTSAQDRILQAVEDCAKAASQEYNLTTGRLEQLSESVHLLAPKSLDVDAQLTERTERLAMKEMLERVDKGVLEQRSVFERLQDLKAALDLLRVEVSDRSTWENILAKLDQLGNTPATALEPAVVEELAQQIKAHISTLDPPIVNLDISQSAVQEIVAKLDDISTFLSGNVTQADLSGIQRTLDEIKEQNVARSGNAPSESEVPSVGISDVITKLDGISTLCQSFIEAKAEASESDQETKTLKQEADEKVDPYYNILVQLLTALRQDADHRTTQAEQTSELVRYSNELNAWLEKFVTSASTQMDNVGAGIGALRRDLGLEPLLKAEEGSEDDKTQQNVLDQLRTALGEQAKALGEVTTRLDSLVTSIQSDLTQNEETRQQKVMETILKMVDTQKQEQEQLLRKLASDLSSDIRGERLRFVEAMSHATSMNIQVHVEEFKKQLTREVLALTDEVGRLRDERKTIQHQIAQLFLIKSEHEAEAGRPEAPPLPSINTRPIAR
ncbi:condensin complex subunit 1 [Ceratobasidium sp. AG-Ba]|nr:condensin complex subunit 1 [Ceratobasidium sp. AG-Ba]